MAKPSCLLVEMGLRCIFCSTLAGEMKRFLDFAFIASSSVISWPLIQVSRFQPLAPKVLIKQFMLLLAKHRPTIFEIILLHRWQLSSTTRVSEVVHLQFWINSLNIYINQLFQILCLIKLKVIHFCIGFPLIPQCLMLLLHNGINIIKLIGMQWVLTVLHFLILTFVC